MSMDSIWVVGPFRPSGGHEGEACDFPLAVGDAGDGSGAGVEGEAAGQGATGHRPGVVPVPPAAEGCRGRGVRSSSPVEVGT